ncbi:MAG: hypothetical protein Ta2G_10560 [Termitinemataceae bacterium]|nr:MAG: hypothetical protein Ta2G_10560 [Termitinemataceae bacterium]
MKKPFKLPLLFVAFRYLIGRGNKGSRYLLGAATGIALSLVPIIVTLIVADGMIRGITDRFLELGTGHLQVWPYRSLPNVSEKVEIAKGIIQDINDTGISVRGVWEEKQGLGIVLGKGGKTGTSIRAVDPSFWEDPGSKRFFTVVEGSDKIEMDNQVLLGQELAKTIGAEAGSQLRIMTVRTTEDGRNIPRTTLFTVHGIVSSGYHELDAMWCIVSLEAGKKMFQGDDSYTYLIVKIENAYKKGGTVCVLY